MMSDNLTTLTRKVWYCLEKYPETRSSDRKLILYIYSEFYGVYNQAFNRVIENTDLPSFESIRRCRQKVQEENEDLRAEKPVEDVRIAKQEEYIEYAKGDIA